MLALGGCRTLLGIDDPVVSPDGGPGDGTADARACYGVAPFELCGSFTPNPAALPSAIDTTMDCDAIVRGWCVVVRSSVSIADPIKVTGSRPLALLALDHLGLSGTISADANLAIPGPGGQPSTGSLTGVIDCYAGMPPVASLNGGGGAAGGSFVTPGGPGGGGSAGQSSGGSPGATVGGIVDLRGGCAGGLGAASPTALADPPGAGGGAVYLLAGTSMSLTGTIDVSGGGGGRGRTSKGGGSGGGSGGMIVLWSPTIVGSPTLIANGGGGGGGADNGAPGKAGNECSSTAAATGGLGGSTLTGVGGNGSFGASPGMTGTTDSTGAGGGGGGGGAGLIRVFGTATWANLMASPPPT